MDKHRTGSWSVRRDTTRRAGQRDEVNRFIITAPTPNGKGVFRVAEIVGPFAGEIEVAEANANLLAASPDLLAVVRALLGCVDDELYSAGDAADIEEHPTLRRHSEVAATARRVIARATKPL